MFRLRIEDTDRQRSTQAAIDAIIDGLGWLGLDWDGEIVHQASRIELHKAAVTAPARRRPGLSLLLQPRGARGDARQGPGREAADPL